MEDKHEHLIHHVSVTDARNLRPLFDEAVREGRPVVITRGRREHALLMSRDTALRLLSPYKLHVDVIPEEEDGGFTLWVRELNIGDHGASLLEARSRLLEAVRAYVRHYHDNWDFYKHLPDKSVQEPYVHRLSLAESDEDLIDMFFGAVADGLSSGQPASEPVAARGDRAPATA